MKRREIRSWLMDMDGVLVHEEHAIPGADRFLARLRERGIPFLVLTNNSIYTRRDLAARLAASGLERARGGDLDVGARHRAVPRATSGPGGSAFVIGEAGLTTALHDAGYTLTERAPDYVVLGETRTYSFERITQAIRLIVAGARFIATNPDPTGPTPDGPLPATGSVAALISRATGVEPYFVGKPNPLMMRSALNAIDAHSETTAMIGDRMDTDVVAGLEAGLETILVLTGVDDARGGRALSVPAVADRRVGRRPRRRARIALRAVLHGHAAHEAGLDHACAAVGRRRRRAAPREHRRRAPEGGGAGEDGEQPAVAPADLVPQAGGLGGHQRSAPPSNATATPRGRTSTGQRESSITYSAAALIVTRPSRCPASSRPRPGRPPPALGPSDRAPKRAASASAVSAAAGSPSSAIAAIVPTA